MSEVRAITDIQSATEHGREAPVSDMALQVICTSTRDTEWLTESKAKIIAAAFTGGVSTASFTVAQAANSGTPQTTCEARAVAKDGKALIGAAKVSFVKKCLADTCVTSAVGKDGKPLTGAAKASYMQKCEKGS
jgi:hypothetical protein